MKVEAIKRKPQSRLIDKIMRDFEYNEIIEITSDEEGGKGIIHWNKIRDVLRKHLGGAKPELEENHKPKTPEELAERLGRTAQPELKVECKHDWLSMYNGRVYQRCFKREYEPEPKCGTKENPHKATYNFVFDTNPQTIYCSKCSQWISLEGAVIDKPEECKHTVCRTCFGGRCLEEPEPKEKKRIELGEMYVGGGITI